MDDSQFKAVMAELAQIKKIVKGAPPVDDFDVSQDPRDWDVAKNGSFVGKKFSQCTPEYLAEVGKMYDAFTASAEKANQLMKNNQPKAPFMKKIADTARAWARHVDGDDW